MAVQKFFDAVVTFGGSGAPPTGGQQLTHVRSVTINYNAAALDVSEMNFATKSYNPGLFEWDVSIDFLQDYSISGTTQIDQYLFPLVGAAAFMFQVQPVSGARSSSNPQWYGTVILTNYQPITGSVGVIQISKCQFKAGGGAAGTPLTRSIT